MDLDGDGHIDLLSGSWPGEIFLFRGGPGRTFAAPEILKDKTGEIINVGGGVRDWQNGGLLITGNAKLEETSEGTFWVYRGKRYKSTPERPVAMTGCAAAIHAVDWDGDGDLDLLVGEIGGSVYLIPNESSAKAYAFGKEQPLQAGGKALKVEGDAGPFTADWDGDGHLDLLVGAGDGSVSLFRNVGSNRQPELANAEVLVPAGKLAYGTGIPKTPVRGIRAKVCATDWNGDGRLDLLVGDFASQAPDHPEPTLLEKVKHGLLRAQLTQVEVRYSQTVGKLYGPKRVKTKDELDRANKEMKEIREQMQELRSRLPVESEYHGWVWLFLRRPAGEQVGER